MTHDHIKKGVPHYSKSNKYKSDQQLKINSSPIKL